MVEKIWRSVDPELFVVVEDLLEDTIQSVAPSIIVKFKTLFSVVFASTINTL